MIFDVFVWGQTANLPKMRLKGCWWAINHITSHFQSSPQMGNTRQPADRWSRIKNEWVTNYDPRKLMKIRQLLQGLDRGRRLLALLR